MFGFCWYCASFNLELVERKNYYLLESSNVFKNRLAVTDMWYLTEIEIIGILRIILTV